MGFHLKSYGSYERTESFETLEEFLEQKKSVKVVKNIFEFTKETKKMCDPDFPTNFLVYPIPDGVLVTVINKKENRLDDSLIYLSEDPLVCQTLYDILRLKVDGTPRYILSCASNYFSFITKKEFLDVIFKYKLLESKNIKSLNKFKITSKNGKVREIIAPENGEITGDEENSFRNTLKRANKILQKVFEKKNSRFQVAYKTGKSVVDNARIHKNKNFIFSLDIKDFFPSCKREFVREILEPVFEIYYNSDLLLSLFLETVLYNDALYIGNPVSGTLANEVISKPALYMWKMGKKYNLEFSIYADDATFSSDKFIPKAFAEGMFKQAFVPYDMETDFISNSKKSRGKSGNRRKITGVSFNSHNQLTIGRRYYREVRSSLEHIRKGDFNYSLQKFRGKLAYAIMVDESKKMKSIITKYLPEVQNNHLVSNEKLKKMGVI